MTLQRTMAKRAIASAAIAIGIVGCAGQHNGHHVLRRKAECGVDVDDRITKIVGSYVVMR